MAEEANEVENEVEYSEIEQQAISMGWRPDGVEGKKNLSAEEFVDRQPIYEDIRSLKKAHRKDRETLEAMKGMMDGIREQERARAIQELNAQKKRALEEENFDHVIEIDEKIAKQRVQETPKRNVDFEEWVESNEWYSEDPEMKDYADLIGDGYSRKHPDKSPSEVYNYVTSEAKKRFPDYFEPKVRKNPVEGASRGRSGGTSLSSRDLNETERGIMKTLIRDGVFKNESEFMKQYIES